jgi:hypothetical protein
VRGATSHPDRRTARLTVHPPRRPTKTFLVCRSGNYEIGRDPACELVLDDARVSRRHARLGAGPEGWTLADLASKNGVSIDGEAITEALLDHPCWVSFGGLMGRFEPTSADSAWSRERARRSRSSTDARRALERDGLEVGALVRRLLDSVLEITRAERGFVLLAGPDGTLRVAGHRGAAGGEDDPAPFTGSESTVRRVLADGLPIAESDTLDDSVLSGTPSVVDGGMRALACLPLEAEGERLGVLYVDSREPGMAFDELDLEILEALSGHAALALRVARLDEALHGLTGRLPTAVPAPDRPAAGATRRARDGDE